jgi:hypothetical protein
MLRKNFKVKQGIHILSRFEDEGGTFWPLDYAFMPICSLYKFSAKQF